MSGPPDQPQQVAGGQRVENSRADPAFQALRLGRCKSGCLAHSRGPPKHLVTGRLCELAEATEGFMESEQHKVGQRA